MSKKRKKSKPQSKYLFRCSSRKREELPNGMLLIVECEREWGHADAHATRWMHGWLSWDRSEEHAPKKIKVVQS